MSAFSPAAFPDGTTGFRNAFSTSFFPDCPSMLVPAEIFRTYDIRGVVGRTLTPDIVRAVGRAAGSLALERGAPTFAVGRDGRLSGPELSNALMEGIATAGAN